MKKGRHRRFEEARALKHTEMDLEKALGADEPVEGPCAECQADPGDDHATWCMAPQALDERDWVD